MEVRWSPHEHNEELPYEVGVPGHVMLANFADGKTGVLNCHHGAPRSLIGGWQAVNLPPEQWAELQAKWHVQMDPVLLPFFWCGKPTGLDKRVLMSVIPVLRSNTAPEWSLDHRVVTEDELRRLISKLNGILVEMKRSPVELNVPDGVDWKTFQSKRTAR